MHYLHRPTLRWIIVQGYLPMKSKEQLPLLSIHDAAEHAIKNSPQITRYRLMLEGNIGKHIRKVFFVNGSRGDIDYYEGKVHSITANNKYLIIYSDGDSEEMNHRENSSSP